MKEKNPVYQGTEKEYNGMMLTQKEICIRTGISQSTISNRLRSGMRLINHIRLWNRWRKHCTNSALYKVLVLMGLIHSPTFERLRGEQDEMC